MRLSHYLVPTIKEIPAEAESISHRLMLRAGLIKQLTSGAFSYLPLGWRVLRKIENIVREEMDAIGSQELYLPALHPLDLWIESGRASVMDEIMFKFQDHKGRWMCLGPTHEEVITDLARSFVHSYRDLPQQWYQIQIKFRDEVRPRGGLIRIRQFTMKDAYSLSTSQEDLNEWYLKNRQAYTNIFTRTGLRFYIVGAHSGAMGGSGSEEFMIPTPTGEDSIVVCDTCGYLANLEVATSKIEHHEKMDVPMENVSTPDRHTIEEVAGYLGVPEFDTMKSVIYMLVPEETPLLVLIRGDLEVSEAKLEIALKGHEYRPAHPDEIKEMSGAEPGFIGPVGLKRKDVRIIIDDSIPEGVPFISGANKDNFHTKGVTRGRDYDGESADLRLACEGDFCTHCDAPLRTERAIEVGHIFKLGTKYSESMGATYLDENNLEKPIIMGCYGIGIERIMAGAIEVNSDENGIIWPMSIAPFQVIVIPLDKRNEQIWSKAEEIYRRLWESGVEALIDDREASPGFKFKDADLFGIPIHIILGKRAIESGNAEVKVRKTGVRTDVSIESLLADPLKALPWLGDETLSRP
ncbi:MAG: proline--tRNA ligase [bacterium]|nr:proline--tRNA ligase [bacterium]